MMPRSRATLLLAVAFVLAPNRSELRGQKPDSLPPGYARDAKGGLVPPKSGRKAALTAPYVAPVVGTREVFTNFSNVITAVPDRWHAKFTDGSGRKGMRTGLFIPDVPASPLAIDTTRLAQFWPLKVGASMALEVARYPRQWIWRFEVTSTERITVGAGTFDTFVVTATASPKTLQGGDAVSTTLYTFWYAPETGTIVRVRSIRTVGESQAMRSGADLLRLERPGKPSLGKALPRVVAPKKKS